MSSIKNKIIPFHKARQKEEETIVLFHGHFNFLHPGHIRYLENASQHGNKLIVAVKGDNLVQDKGEKHFFNQDERALGVAAIQSVDQVVLLGNMQLEDAVKKISLEAHHLLKKVLFNFFFKVFFFFKFFFF